MFMPIGFIGPLKKENEALRKEIAELRAELEALKQKKVLANFEDFKPAEARAFRSSGNSDAAMLADSTPHIKEFGR